MYGFCVFPHQCGERAGSGAALDAHMLLLTGAPTAPLSAVYPGQCVFMVFSACILGLPRRSGSRSASGGQSRTRTLKATMHALTSRTSAASGITRPASRRNAGGRAFAVFR